MDQKQTGAFLAQLRKEAGLTQMQLGEKLGVTNKTISRWECGNYMPDLDTCLLLSELFGVTINELLLGQRLSDSEMRQTANRVLVQAVRSPFSPLEQKKYYLGKWNREHTGQMILSGAVWLGLFLAALLHPAVTDGLRPLLTAGATLVGLCLWAGINNRRMAYVGSKLYSGSPEQQTKK
jgi:transcriptional regulator with XRE-family HTH domain